MAGMLKIQPGMRVCARASLCAHTCSGGEHGGGGCLPVRDSEQRAGGLGMEQRICIDCFCASELFSHCQSCLHQLRGKLLHLHQEVFTFYLKKKNTTKYTQHMYFHIIIPICVSSVKNFEVFRKHCRISCHAFSVLASDRFFSLSLFFRYV